MTVKELKQKLCEFPDDMSVYSQQEDYFLNPLEKLAVLKNIIDDGSGHLKNNDERGLTFSCWDIKKEDFGKDILIII
jgi:hypothetical protein